MIKLTTHSISKLQPAPKRSSAHQHQHPLVQSVCQSLQITGGSFRWPSYVGPEINPFDFHKKDSNTKELNQRADMTHSVPIGALRGI
jgi:hypothetical protein